MPAITMPADLFDDYVDTYEVSCAEGLRLAGEHRDYFARQRVQHSSRKFADPQTVRQVIDFGCGLGHSVPYLAEKFPLAQVTGLDPAARAIEAARQRYNGPRTKFCTNDATPKRSCADLVYCNGVFHHIEVNARHGEAKTIYDLLAPGGLCALWENNPWNPGTRLVMSRIPFDKDAVTLSCLEAQTLLRSVGFRVVDTRFYFYFPHPLRLFRAWEPLLERLPLGAQYCVWGQKPLRIR